MAPVFSKFLGVSASLAALTSLTHAAAPYCVPGDSCFPADSELQAFNSSINGRLIKNTPYGAACYKATYDAEACKQHASLKHTYGYRLPMPAALMYTNVEMTEGGAGCPVPEPSADGSAPAAIDGECTLGRMSTYSVNATDVDDIVATVKFAKEYNLMFRIKNTGHDYTGRSSGVGSFALWTQHMKDVDFIKDFTACPSSSSENVLAIGPAVNVGEVYAAGAKNGVVSPAGFTASVGAGGGFVLGGGTGPMGHFLGLGVDSVVQFEVVTADGEKKIANDCTNTDLFWAMRGGGGAFAVTTKTYFKTAPAPTAVNTAVTVLKCQNKDDWKSLMTKLIQMQVPLREKGFVGIWQTNSGTWTTAIVNIQPTFSGPIKELDAFSELLSPLLNISTCKGALNAKNWTGTTAWNEAYKTALLPLLTPSAPGGTNIVSGSRLIENDLIKSEAGLQKIIDFVHNLDPTVSFIWQNSVGTAANKISPDATAVHPKWRNTFAFFNLPISGPFNGTTAAQTAVSQSTLDDADAVFGDTPYYNEMWFLEKDWQHQTWGTNYAKLLEIKGKVDPDNLFSCARCVGSDIGL